jgi:large subunit ribosomal protein L22
MDVHASLRHLHMAPRKVRLVVDLIRSLPVAEAELRLNFLKRDAALPVLKLLRSAIANAEHNFKLDRTTLVVKTITADSGVTMKRSRPRAMGRAAPIRKRTTHINLVLAPVSEITFGKKKAKKMAAIKKYTKSSDTEVKAPVKKASRSKKAKSAESTTA